MEEDPLDREASLEKMDTAITIIGIKGWVFMSISLALMILVIFWTFLGVIPIAVSGKCVVYNPKNSPHYYSRLAQIFKEEPDLDYKSLTRQVQDRPSLEEQSDLPLADALKGGTDLPELEILGFFPLFQGQTIKPGMEARCALDIFDIGKYGMLRGTVEKVLPYPVSASDPLLQKIPSESLREYLVEGKTPSILVLIRPIPDPGTPSAFAWTSKRGPPDAIRTGTTGTANVTLKKVSPMSYVIPSLKDQ
jgi:hypothetical protein